MKSEYDFQRGRRGSVLPARGKTRITMFVDDDILTAFRREASTLGMGYQTLINEALRETPTFAKATSTPEAVAEPQAGYLVLSRLEQRLVQEIRRVEGMVSAAAGIAPSVPSPAPRRTAKRGSGRR
jgi:BrnA antitoxin of type II toxin-antitoxin system